MLGIFLDTETNGLNPFKHRSLEIAFKIYNLSTGNCVDSYQSLLNLSESEWSESNQESLKINGFTWQDTLYGKQTHQVTNEITTLFQKNHIKRGKAVFICQNPSFDRMFFTQIIDPELQEINNWPYHWLDLASMFWSYAFLQQPAFNPWSNGFTKNQIAHFFGIPPEKTPHRAMHGVEHLIRCYEAMIGFRK